MTKEFIEPKPISVEDMDCLAGSIDALRALSIRTPKSAKQVHIENRLADYLKLVEHDYLRGWEDCEYGKRVDLETCRHFAKLPAAYDAGFSDCYEWENQSDGYGEDMG